MNIQRINNGKRVAKGRGGGGVGGGQMERGNVVSVTGASLANYLSATDKGLGEPIR